MIFYYLTTVPVATYNIFSKQLNQASLNMVSERSLIKFKQIYYKKYNIQLTDEEATEQATMFLQLMTVLLKPSPTPNKKEQTENQDFEEISIKHEQLDLL